MPSFGWYVIITAAVLLCIYLALQILDRDDDADPAALSAWPAVVIDLDAAGQLRQLED